MPRGEADVKIPRDIIVKPIEKLIPYARNARTHSDEQVAQIAASMREWGWTNPVLISSDNAIIAGHGRILAARKLGLETVPCIVADGWTKTQIRAYCIADNKLALNADWDHDILRIELDDLRSENFDLNLLGFDSIYDEDVSLPELSENTNHLITIRYTDDDEDSIKIFVEQDNNMPLSPIQTGAKILERIKKVASKADF